MDNKNSKTAIKSPNKTTAKASTNSDSTRVEFANENEMETTKNKAKNCKK